jgi:hypothetical protein
MPLVSPAGRPMLPRRQAHPESHPSETTRCPRTDLPVSPAGLGYPWPSQRRLSARHEASCHLREAGQAAGVPLPRPSSARSPAANRRHVITGGAWQWCVVCVVCAMCRHLKAGVDFGLGPAGGVQLLH